MTDAGTIIQPSYARPRKLRAPGKVYRLIKRTVKGKTVSRYWQVRLRLGKGQYKQRSAQTEMRAAAQEFALLWIKQDYPALCRLLDLKPLTKAVLPPPPNCHSRRCRKRGARCLAAV